jgi:hypothetical protein
MDAARPVSGQVYPKAADGGSPIDMAKVWPLPHAGQTSHCIRIAIFTLSAPSAFPKMTGTVRINTVRLSSSIACQEKAKPAVGEGRSDRQLTSGVPGMSDETALGLSGR